MSVQQAKRGAKDAAESSWIEGLGRFGLGAKGISYAIVAILAIQVATGDRGKPEDRAGALQRVADEPFGSVLVGFLALGFAGYAIWRLVDAIFNRGDEGDDAKGFGKRAAHAGQGIVYAGLCVLAVSVLMGSGGGGGSGEEDRLTGKVLEWPLGRWLVGAAALGIIGAGVVNAYKAVTQKFRENLKTSQMSAEEDRWYTRIGMAGHGARAVVFGLIGAFLGKAALEYDPKEAVGLDGALSKLVQQSHGPWLLGVVAVGLLAYGLFSLVQMRYRDV